MPARTTRPARGLLGPLAALATLLVCAAPASAAPGRPEPGRSAAREALQQAADARAGVRGAPEVTIANRDLAVSVDALGADDRKRARAILARPTDTQPLIPGPNDDLFYYGDATVKQVCDAHFCIHYATSGPQAPAATDTTGASGVAGTTPNGVPDYIDLMLRTFQRVRSVENDTLGWRAPAGDGYDGEPAAQAQQLPNRLDVYVGDVGSQGVYGYAVPESRTTDDRTYDAYMVMDEDYSEFGYPAPEVPLQVTAAHEYNHVLQFATDVYFDSWFGESTATWMEDQVYPAGNDWLNYLRSWRTVPEFPITSFSPDDADNARALKVYGSSVFLHWLADNPAVGGTDPRGVDTIRDAWNAMRTTRPADFAVGAIDAGLAAHGGSTTSALFGRFAAATAEWRVPGSGFHDRERYASIPVGGTAGVDMVRAATLTTATPRTTTLDHLGYRLYDVAKPAADGVRLTVTAPAGVASSISLVGRTGGIDTGTVTISRTELPSGGTGSVDLTGLSGFSRVTAIVTNSDTRVSLYGASDWVWPADGSSYTLALGTDLSTTPAPPTTTQPTPTTTTPATTTPAPTTTSGTTQTTTTTATAAPSPTTITPTAPTTTTAAPVPNPTPSPFTLTKASILSPLGVTSRALARTLSSHGITKLRRGVSGLAFRAPGAGRLTVSVRVGSRTVASGSRTATARAPITVRVRSTVTGRRRLAARPSRRVTLVLRFTPKVGAAQTVRRTITIRR
jgi:hypothetical protein